MQERILVIDDDMALSSLLVTTLRPKGFEVISAPSAKTGLRLAYQEHPDLVLLDIMMPEMDGWQTCERLREISDVPIIMLTAKTDEENVVKGLRLGADDYVKKPFGIVELEERIRALLRRSKAARNDPALLYQDNRLQIDARRQQVWRSGEIVHLTPTEYRLLCCLIEHKGEIVPHETLLVDVWGQAYTDASASLALYIRYLREKIEEDPKCPRYIQNQRGVGYMFVPQRGITTLP